ncbi:MAG: imidazole glycerol phosphate synthase subunit HisF [Armatimonadetes bacterium CG07_land_8_20_14_0_80_59_28]|nr:MAG: imidazole glycerol phosphate synthase subunit HisF [Armatimonadetes bacterium CG07_land_8_20_14_0_80_59_28]PIX45047.1 MAG: imidazole glycerol phosphate synthase subunit HisF [Armatimonadetes bacterium CG_4_8_14_3_um_filter_58_9]PJB67651.1 MAG: imidazole glycerol phosphate synthase subunit HisF [Armatimonadetes bacterium CG_4_9_14_3_um_filter_58_7]
MVAKRIIPCLDVTEGRVVKGTHFVDLRDAGDPVELAAEYDRQRADELVFLDITASSDRRDIILQVASRTSEEVFIPYTVGGGIRTVEDMRKILQTGADKISINTAAIKRPELIREGAERFGSQCVVVAIDARRRRRDDDERAKNWRVPAPKGWEIYVNGGRTPTGIDAVQWAARAESLGAGEILLTSMDADGAQDGYDIALTRIIAETVGIPVIASGGAGTMEHMYDVFTEGKAEAALIASIVHYGKYTVHQIKEYLHGRGVPVRL